jgi:superfamily II RNA helicase
MENLATAQKNDPTFRKEFIFSKREAQEYIAKLLEYKITEAPNDEEDSNTRKFIDTLVANIKEKLQAKRNLS